MLVRMHLGPDHVTPDDVTVTSLDAQLCIGISVGGSGLSAASLNKRDDNEDAVLGIVDGTRVLLAVADAHFGARASATWISRLATQGEIPPDIDTLRETLDRLAPLQVVPNTDALADEQGASATSLCVAVVDRASRVCFGVCYGDASLLRIHRRRGRWSHTLLTPKQDCWIQDVETPERMRELATIFREDLEDDDRIVLFTDGVDECCYGRPDRSVRLVDIVALHEAMLETGGTTRSFVLELAGLALTGVRGQPGGQDNLVIAATDLRTRI